MKKHYQGAGSHKTACGRSTTFARGWVPYTNVKANVTCKVCRKAMK